VRPDSTRLLNTPPTAETNIGNTARSAKRMSRGTDDAGDAGPRRVARRAGVTPGVGCAQAVNFRRPACPLHRVRRRKVATSKRCSFRHRLPRSPYAPKRYGKWRRHEGRDSVVTAYIERHARGEESAERTLSTWIDRPLGIPNATNRTRQQHADSAKPQREMHHASGLRSNYIDNDERLFMNRPTATVPTRMSRSRGLRERRDGARAFFLQRADSAPCASG